ncbi:MAG: hypothetical protein J6J11_07495 [Treponema sp.]|nr:hypothetical protein [Treponema sp.]
MEEYLWLWIIIYLISSISFVIYLQRVNLEHYADYRMLKFLFGFILLLIYFGASIFIGYSMIVKLNWNHGISILISIILIVVPWIIAKKIAEGTII